jgi:chloride channel 3/4/5
MQSASHFQSNGHLDSDSDEDLTAIEGINHDVLSSDPLNTTSNARTNSRGTLGISLPRFLSSDLADGPPTPTTPITPISPGPNLRRRHTPTIGAGESSNYFFGISAGDNDSVGGSPNGATHDKDTTSSTDWYQEGPGRRVGYEDLTAIDWIFEYAKERQRLRLLLSSATGAVGQLKRLLDASQIWVILVLTGIVTGLVAAVIDVISDWLGDLKQGVCRGTSGNGKFYLNKTFCCWGLDGTSRMYQAG